MTDLQTILIIAGAALLLFLLVLLLLRSSRQKVIQRPEADAGEPYVATKERPYMQPPAPNVSDPPLARTAEPDPVDIAQPAIPVTGDLAGIAFPPHSTDHADDLTRLKGVGPKLAAMLNDQGITRYEQLASLDAAGLAAIDARLGNFAGRLQRDRVTEQARYLASGDTAAFEAQFGKLGG